MTYAAGKRGAAHRLEVGVGGTEASASKVNRSHSRAPLPPAGISLWLLVSLVPSFRDALCVAHLWSLRLASFYIRIFPRTGRMAASSSHVHPPGLGPRRELSVQEQGPSLSQPRACRGHPDQSRGQESEASCVAYTGSHPYICGQIRGRGRDARGQVGGEATTRNRCWRPQLQGHARAGEISDLLEIPKS